jgi:hypothetical protein
LSIRQQFFGAVETASAIGAAGCLWVGRENEIGRHTKHTRKGSEAEKHLARLDADHLRGN